MLVVSLTSIPPRFSTLPKVIAALWGQDLPPDRILLTIPQSYRRFPDSFGLPDLPDVEILRPSTDPGPAAKVLPAAKALQGQECHLLYCDDDWIYHPEWSAGFLHAAKAQTTESVICASGFNAERVGGTSGVKAGFVDIAQGFGGVLIRPNWLAATTFSPPEHAWCVDDIWLSGMYAQQGLGIQHVPGLRAFMSPIADPNNLQNAVLNGLDRATANRQTARHLAKSHNIWGGVSER